MRLIRLLIIIVPIVMNSYFTFSQDNVNIVIAPTEDRLEISPYIYGRNNSLSDNPSSPLSSSDWLRIKDAGVTFFRESGGNNCTKYNWKKKLGSHPDWYNNVYSHDWDYEVQTLQENIPEAQGMWAFQLLGKVAKSTDYNFNDWGYNSSKWWDGVHQNLAGGGVVNESGGSEALKDGNPDLYLQDWPADSTVAILNHWFGESGLGIDSGKAAYWNMDNEAEIWSGTHDDVMPEQISAEEFMQIYFEVAKKARAEYPGIKLVGPVAANEWQWYNWNNKPISYKGNTYCWMEYFILRIGEEQLSSGVKLLDVLDIHYYPSSSTPEEIVQFHRVYFDRDYIYPEANGVKTVDGGWNNNINKEYILGRCNDWLNEYIGENHGVNFGVTETGINTNDPDVCAVWYASTLGEFMKKGVEIFTPWTWTTGMWEVLHLFSRYNLPICVKSNSSDEEFVSAYTSVSSDNDSITIVLVNRSTSVSKNVTVEIGGYKFKEEVIKGLKLENLPSTETFNSEQDNALVEEDITTTSNSFSIVLQPLSIVSIQSDIEQFAGLEETNNSTQFGIFPNPVYQNANITVNAMQDVDIDYIKIINTEGKVLGVFSDWDSNSSMCQLNLREFDIASGNYIIQIEYPNNIFSKEILVLSDK